MIFVRFGLFASAPPRGKRASLYSRYMHGLKLAGIELDRKVLAETATADAAQFALIVGQVKTALTGASK